MPPPGERGDCPARVTQIRLAIAAGMTGSGVEGAGRTDELATKQREDGRAVAAAPEPLVFSEG